jgi:sugar lactone lactonase YvrE
MTTKYRRTIELIACLLCVSPAIAQPEVEIRHIGGFGKLGDFAPGDFQWAAGLALDGEGKVIVADNGNHRIQRCTDFGECEIIGGKGRQLGAFTWPLGVAVDSKGRIIVSEAGNDRIQLLDPEGTWTSFGSTGRVNPGDFRLPAGLAVDDQDRIIVADEKNDRIQICLDNGNCSAFGERGSALGMFNTPRDVALASQNRILVTDYWNHRIQVCSYEGDCTAFGGFGRDAGEFNQPAGIAVDHEDRVIIAESGNHRIQICSLNGECVAWGEYGAGPGQFHSPQAAAVDEQNRLYIGELDNNRVQIFQASYDNASFSINPGLNDAWYDPTTNGQGFLITVFPTAAKLFLAWFTYDIERPPENVSAVLGEPGHRWLTAQGPYNGDTATLTVYISEGGVFDSALPAVSTNPDGDGTIVLEFADCSEGLLSYEIDSLNLSGKIPIQRITPDNVALCETLTDP